MFIDHATLRNTINAPVSIKIREVQWLAAFAAYNARNTAPSRVDISDKLSYNKVLAFIMNQNITQI